MAYLHIFVEYMSDLYMTYMTMGMDIYIRALYVIDRASESLDIYL